MAALQEYIDGESKTIPCPALFQELLKFIGDFLPQGSDPEREANLASWRAVSETNPREALLARNGSYSIGTCTGGGDAET